MMHIGVRGPLPIPCQEKSLTYQPVLRIYRGRLRQSVPRPGKFCRRETIKSTLTQGCNPGTVRKNPEGVPGMRIEWTPPLRRAAARRDGKIDAAAEGSFASALEGEPAAPPPAPATAVGLVSGLLTVQEVPDQLARRRRAVQRGDAMLDRLDELRLGLLAGGLPRRRLDELAELARTARDTVDDPRLVVVLDEIDLRVAVELAKLDREL